MIDIVFLFLVLIPPLMCGAYAIRVLLRKPFQFGICELLLLPFAFLPTVAWGARAFKHGDMNFIFLLIPLYQICGGWLAWNWARSRRSGWFPALLLVAGAWLGLLVGITLFIVLAIFFISAGLMEGP